VNCFNIR